MHSRLIGELKGMAQAIASGRVGCTYGVVTGYDPKAYAVKVTLQPPPPDRDDVETGWLPIMSPWVGNGWGFYAPPAKGDQVLILFPEGDIDVGVCIGALYNDKDRPLDVPQGEMWLQHAGGAFVKFLTNGTIASKGTWNHDGDLNATGDVKAGNISLKTHKHTEQGDGADVSAPHP